MMVMAQIRCWSKTIYARSLLRIRLGMAPHREQNAAVPGDLHIAEERPPQPSKVAQRLNGELFWARRLPRSRGWILDTRRVEFYAICGYLREAQRSESARCLQPAPLLQIRATSATKKKR